MVEDILKFSLPDLLQIAVSTVALVIASSIFFQCLSTKYIAVVERYRGLTGEYRGGHPSEPRHGSLQRQIEIYKQQIHYLTAASACLAFAILVFLLTIATASLSAMLPWVMPLKIVSAASLFVGLILVGIGVFLELRENWLAREAVFTELDDLQDIPNPHELNRSPLSSPGG